MKLKNIISEQVDNLFCCEGVLTWQEMNILGEPINLNKSYVLVIGFGKPFNKIHGDMCPSHLELAMVAADQGKEDVQAYFSGTPVNVVQIL